MRILSDFLGRFRRLRPPEKTVEGEAERILKEIFHDSGFDCRVSFKKPKLIIYANSASVKNEIFLKKEEILKKLKEKFSNCPINVWFN